MADANAYSRHLGTPLQINDFGSIIKRLGERGYKFEYTGGDQVSGSYNPVNDKIEINIPPAGDWKDTLDAIKHEMTHQFLKFAKLPKMEDYKENFKQARPSFLKEPLKSIMFDPAMAPGPSNLFQFRDWHRGGYYMDELPAYMNIFDPKYSPVSQEVRDQYMQDLVGWLKKQGQFKALEGIQYLDKTRKAYR